MVKKKTTKEIRAIDRIIKFQIDDGIESITIAGKEALADLEIDNKNNVTLYLNADKDKINELNSLVPFINLTVKEEGVDPDKTKFVTLSQDLTQFALEIADNSKELASIIKSEFSIILDLDGLVQQLLEIAGKLAELEAKNLEQDNRLTVIESKNLEQDNRLTVIETKDQDQDNRLTVIETKDQDQDNRLTVIETKDLGYEDYQTILPKEFSKKFDRLNKNTPIENYYVYSKNLIVGDDIEAPGIMLPFNGNYHMTIARYKNGWYDGSTTISYDTSVRIKKSNIPNRPDLSTLRQEKLFEMRTISDGDIKLLTRLHDTDTPNTVKFELYSPKMVAGKDEAYSVEYLVEIHGYAYDNIGKVVKARKQQQS